jgi:hypothetical protein
VGARPAAIDGAISSGGGNGGRGNRRRGERMGRQHRFRWSGDAREVSRWPEGSGGGGASAGGGRRPWLLDARRKRVKGAGPDWVEMLGPKVENNWADMEKSKGKRTSCRNHLGKKTKLKINGLQKLFFFNFSSKT